MPRCPLFSGHLEVAKVSLRGQRPSTIFPRDFGLKPVQMFGELESTEREHDDGLFAVIRGRERQDVECPREPLSPHFEAIPSHLSAPHEPSPRVTSLVVHRILLWLVQRCPLQRRCQS